MRDLLICVLALTWVLVVIRQMGTRRYPRETADHIDRDFRDLVEREDRRRARWGADAVPAADRVAPEECRDHGPDCRRRFEGSVVVHRMPGTPILELGAYSEWDTDEVPDGPSPD